MNMKDFALTATELAAVAASRTVGLGNSNLSDEVATTAMRNFFLESGFNGIVKIGEGEMDEAPMLYIGEKFGTGNDYDIAVDPVEGTKCCIYNKAGAVSVIVIAKTNGIINAPDVYMSKLAALDLERLDIMDINEEIDKNILNYSKYTKKNISDINIIMLKRDRHQHFIDKIRTIGARITFIEDGDVGGVLKTSSHFTDQPVDIYLGTGGAPEGVIVSSVANNLNGFFQGKFISSNAQEESRFVKMNINTDKTYTSQDLISTDSVFSMSGITTSEFIHGVEISNTICKIESLIVENNYNISKICRTRKI